MLDKSVEMGFANVASATTDQAFTKTGAGGTAFAATPGRSWRVLAAVIVGGTSVAAVTFNSKPAGAGSAISAAFSPAASTQLLLGDSGGWIQTKVGEGLTVTTGASTTTVAIQVSAVLVAA